MEVESSEQFSFGVKAKENTTTKENRAQSGKLDEFNEQVNERNSRNSSK